MSPHTERAALAENLARSAKELTRDITTGHDWPNTQEELDRLNAATWMRKAAAALASTQADSEPVADLRDIISQHLTAAYACTRVWEAWSVGTMTEDDFVPLGETEFVEELACAIESAAPRSSSQAAVMLNGLTEAETSASASVAGLSAPRSSRQAVAGQEDETPSVEVWHGERKVTIYVGENVLRIWGPNTNAEMSEEPYSLKSVGDAMDWLYAPVAGQEQAPVGARDIIEMLCNGLEWNIENAPEVMGQADDEALAQARAWLAAHPQGVGAAEPEGAMEMALCESISMVLREGQLYRFVKVGDCEKCAAMSAASFKAYGPATNTQAEGQP